eukprot:CAMPEP_0197031992 /NCGR_PEP_ID=MMETSP1384-20130603/10787_1 /TAXON_ID=29189 /ORGANISM="Ammonia sp." /LENGTH=467 /DNA_ID=CAMNT_0042461585 /DNA_START=24 /DNA_END=1427 /DNA_ORIENTATION=-
MPSFKKRQLSPNSIFDKDGLLQFLQENNIKQLHAKTIWRLMMKNPNLEFSEITNLPKRAVALLAAHFVPLTSKVKSCSTSSDKKTTKLLIELQDGNMIETVVIRHSDTRSGGHNVVCVSSQIGCKMGCTFCATGTLGLIGHLKAAEILEQILHAKLNVDQDIRNIVFMGMGEPLDNYDQVKQAMHGMHERAMFNLAWNHITLSTVGVVSKMRAFTQDFPKANLALSLHAPSQKVRQQIVPTSTAFTVKKIIDAVVYHIEQTQNKIFIEYIMIGNVNAATEHALELANLFIANKITNKICINLIPYNPTDIGDKHRFTAPTEEQLNEFKEVIMKNGIFCTIRKSTTSGRDVDGACGQLALKGNPDIEDLIKRKAEAKSKRNRPRLRKKKTEMLKTQEVDKLGKIEEMHEMDAVHCKVDESKLRQFVSKINRQSVLIGSAVLVSVGVTYLLYRSRSNAQNRRDSSQSKS